MSAMEPGWAITGLASRSAEPAARPGEPQRLAAAQASYADFGVPPIYRSSINRVQLDLLALAREALLQAGWDEGALDTERTEVILVTGFGMNRGYENHARMLGTQLADAYARELPERQRFVEAAKQALDQEFAATSHDKVGEMASSMAARIASCFKLRGRAIALEAADQGGVLALQSAIDALSQGRASSVLVLGAQRFESALMLGALRARLGPLALAEGACALLLQNEAARPERVRARLAGVRSLPEAAASQVCRATAPELLGALAAARWQRDSDADAGAALARSAPADVAYSYSIEALSLLARAVQQVQSVPEQNCHALGQGLDGGCYLMSVQPACAASACTGDLRQAAVAIRGAGARFGSTAGLDAYWQALRQTQAQFRPLQDEPCFEAALFRRADEAAALSYGIDRAAHARRGHESTVDGLDRSCEQLAAAAAEEALARLPGTGASGAWSGRPLLVVLATNLTQPAERRLVAQEYLPRIEQTLQRVAETQALTPAQQTRALAALRDAAWLPALEAPSEGWLEQLPASRIAARIGAQAAERLGASALSVVALEAACAGSLAAIELAMLRLRSGEIGAALVIGAEMPVNVHDLCLCSAQRMLAPELIATFTAEATGFTPGDGAGALLLSLAEASDEGLALLRAIGSCTESKSIIAPNTAGQTKSMLRAFEQVEHGPADIGFIETHGTGTLIGDEVELASLEQIYGSSHEPTLALGALKTLFGHCFAAAGMASVIKTVLALRHEQLPPNRIDAPLKPELRFAERHFDALLQPRAWPRQGRRRRAAVNAFGTGGINAHLLIDESLE